MSWTLYRWVWQLRSPLHIGYMPAGTLNRTRLYIPARNMWAALTAEIARRQASNFPDYAGVGQALQQHARFTYLYPAEYVNGKWYAWLPRYVQEEKRFGLYWYREDGAVDPLSDRAFRRRLLHTQASTAIAAGTGAAEEGTLREVEYIQPFWRPERPSSDRTFQPVAFVGYVCLQNNALPIDLSRNIRELRLGGEQRYGFGHLELIPHSEREPWEPASSCFGYTLQPGKEDLCIKPQDTSCFVLAHTYPGSSSFRGAWEVVVYWDMHRLRTQNKPLWQPGTKIEETNIAFRLCPNGWWEVIKDEPLS